MKKTIILAVMLLLAIFATACGEAEKQDQSKLRVALVVTGSINDNGW